LLAPRLEPVENLDTQASPFSLGALLGFGFVGLIFGSFAGWCIGLITKQSGQALLKNMVVGAIAGGIIGIVAGNILSRVKRARATS
jgi:H+/Cl- antiporter ClcA